MHNVNIEIFCIAQTRMNGTNVRKWLDHVGAHKTPVPQEVTDAGAVCGLCAKRCYMSFEPGLNPNVTRVRKVWHDYLSNILKSGHGSVIEHATWTFAIEGISRVFTGELNRHRAGVAISEGSMRYIRFDDIGFWMPTSLAEGNMTLMPTAKCKVCKGSGKKSNLPGSCSFCFGTGRLSLLSDEEFEEKKALTRGMFDSGFRQMETNYRDLCNIWGIEDMKAFGTKKKLTSMFRRLIGMGVATGGTWTFNARALRHVIALRTSPHAEEEIALVCGMIGKYMVENEPSLFGDFSLDSATGAWVPENAKI
jgi:thymidylate synthase (FAD)